MTVGDEQPHWTESVYRDNARLLFDVEAALFQNGELTRKELAAVRQLAASVGAELSSPIVDIACGPGRHTHSLAREGHDVTGVDFSPGLLELAREEGAKALNGGTRANFVVGDMRALGFGDGTFSTVLSLGNSFGYFSDADNLRALAEACRVARRGGFLCFEITHKEKYLEHFETFSEEVVVGRFHPPLRCEWRKSWDPTSRRITTHERHCVASTGEVLYEGPYDVRLFDIGEMVGLFQDLGLRSVTHLAFAPGRDMLQEGLGDTFGALGQAVFVGGIKA